MRSDLTAVEDKYLIERERNPFLQGGSTSKPIRFSFAL